MGSESIGKKTVLGIGWRMMERILAQLVTFVVSLVLARLLSPGDYGAVAIITVFITIANVFITDGFSAALIQKKNTDALDYTSVTIGGFVLSVFLYLICFFCAPWIAEFYDMPILSPTLRVLALRLPIASINSVQVAYVSKKMQFKKFFWATFGGTMASAVVGIYMALNGYGVWALVAQSLSNYTIDTIVLALSIRRFPKLRFSMTRLKGLLSFGYKILLTNLLFVFIDQLRTLVIGKRYSSEDLAYYSKGKSFPQMLSTNISGPISNVLFPALSTMQDSVADVRHFMRRSIRTISFLVPALLLGFAAVSKNFVLLVLTEKWLPCVPFIFLGAVYYLLPPIHSTNLEAVKAVGKSDQVLKYGMIKRGVSVAALLATLWFGALGIMLGLIASAVIATCINAYQNKKLFEYSYKEQLFDDEAIAEIEDVALRYDLPMELITKIIASVEKNKHITRNNRLQKEFDKLIQQEWIHVDAIKDGLDNEDN